MLKQLLNGNYGLLLILTLNKFKVLSFKIKFSGHF